MILYENTKAGFLKDVSDKSIATKLEIAFRVNVSCEMNDEEVISWGNSPKEIGNVLKDEDIPDNCGIALEYCVPPTAKRIDFMISGYDENGEKNAVIVELKQWQELKAVQDKDAVVRTDIGGEKNKEVVHPSYQAYSYAELLEDYNQAVQDDDIHLSPCVYMHNYIRKENDPLDEKQYESYLTAAPAFTKGMEGELQDFIKSRIVKGDDKAIITAMNESKNRPSKRLQEAVGGMLDGHPEYTLVDEQKVAYADILAICQKAKDDPKKQVIIVKGGPGTGKSVIAVNLLAELTKEGQNCQYASSNKAPRNAYKDNLTSSGTHKNSKAALFQWSGHYFIKSDSGKATEGFDTILADEAHRLNEKSGKINPYGENQIQRIIQAAKCSVFFIDEGQQVTLDDIGSIDEIRKWAESENAEITEMELTSQFRCNGCDGYLTWLNNVLENEGNDAFNPKSAGYDLQIFDSPDDLREAIVALNDQCENGARIVAGYCWEWPYKDRGNKNTHEVNIDGFDFEMSWNLEDTSGTYPSEILPYAVDPESINQVGCIHTVQGLEFDYVGVIIGDDMFFKDGKIDTDREARAKDDFSLKGIEGKFKTEQERKEVADRIIKNTYRVLMTRGMKGCYVYCTDQDLADYLRSQINTDDES